MASLRQTRARRNSAYAAGLEEVYRAFTDPSLARQWFKPKAFSIEEFDFQPAVGRGYRIALRAPDGTRYAHEGVFVRVSAPMELACAWRWVEGPLARDETLVELRFESIRKRTLVRLRHSRFPSAAMRERHDGWREALDTLDGWLASRSA